MAFGKRAKSGNWDDCGWDVRQGSRASVRVLSEDDRSSYSPVPAYWGCSRPAAT